MGCGPSSEAGAAAGGAGGAAAASGSKSTSVAGANAGKKFGDSYKLGKEVRIMDRERLNGPIVPCRKPCYVGSVGARLAACLLRLCRQLTSALVFRSLYN
jgi:hypothetical protein